jgi:hypothetical protein
MYTVVPHHHHGQTPCFVLEFCGEGNVFGDEHTHHHDTPGEDAGSCVAESKYIVRPFNDNTGINVSYSKIDDHNHIYLFPVYYLAASCVNYGAGDSFLTTEYWEYLIFYRHAEANQFHGLRAPPSVFS